MWVVCFGQESTWCCSSQKVGQLAGNINSTYKLWLMRFLHNWKGIHVQKNFKGLGTILTNFLPKNNLFVASKLIYKFLDPKSPNWNFPLKWDFPVSYSNFSTQKILRWKTNYIIIKYWYYLIFDVDISINNCTLNLSYTFMVVERKL